MTQYLSLRVITCFSVKMFQCELCPKNYQLEESLTVHNRSVHEDIRYNCRVCDYKATTKSSLAAHNRGVHGTTKIQCEQCEFQCKWKSTLKQQTPEVVSLAALGAVGRLEAAVGLFRF